MAVTISRFVINPSWSSAKKVPASWEDISLSFGKNAFASLESALESLSPSQVENGEFLLLSSKNTVTGIVNGTKIDTLFSQQMPSVTEGQVKIAPKSSIAFQEVAEPITACGFKDVSLVVSGGVFLQGGALTEKDSVKEASKEDKKGRTTVTRKYTGSLVSKAEGTLIAEQSQAFSCGQAIADGWTSEDTVPEELRELRSADCIGFSFQNVTLDASTVASVLCGGSLNYTIGGTKVTDENLRKIQEKKSQTTASGGKLLVSGNSCLEEGASGYQTVVVSGSAAGFLQGGKNTEKLQVNSEEHLDDGTVLEMTDWTEAFSSVGTLQFASSAFGGASGYQTVTVRDSELSEDGEFELSGGKKTMKEGTRTEGKKGEGHIWTEQVVSSEKTSSSGKAQVLDSNLAGMVVRDYQTAMFSGSTVAKVTGGEIQEDRTQTLAYAEGAGTKVEGAGSVVTVEKATGAATLVQTVVLDAVSGYDTVKMTASQAQSVVRSAGKRTIVASIEMGENGVVKEDISQRSTISAGGNFQASTMLDAKKQTYGVMWIGTQETPGGITGFKTLTLTGNDGNPVLVQGNVCNSYLKEQERYWRNSYASVADFDGGSSPEQQELLSEKSSYVANGKATLTYVDIEGDLCGYATVKLDSSIVNGMVQGGNVETHRNVESAEEVLDAAVAQGTVMLTDSVVKAVCGYKSVQMSGSVIGGMASDAFGGGNSVKAISLQVKSGLNAIGKIMGSEGKDTISIAGKASLAFEDEVLWGGGGDTLSIAGEAIARADIFNGLEKVSGKGMLSLTSDLYEQYAEDVRLASSLKVQNIGNAEQAEGYRGLAWEQGDNTANTARCLEELLAENDGTAVGWLGGSADTQDWLAFSWDAEDGFNLQTSGVEKTAVEWWSAGGENQLSVDILEETDGSIVWNLQEAGLADGDYRMRIVCGENCGPATYTVSKIAG